MATMKQKRDVYYGPNTSTYPEAGTVSTGEQVTVLWKETNTGTSWCYIEYAVDNSNKHKRAYVQSTYVNITESVATKTMSSLTRYANKDTDVFFGPSEDDYPSAGSIDYAEKVKYLGVKENNEQYAFIEYDVTGTTQKKRAWVYHMNLNGDPPTGLVVGQRPSDMDITSSHYTSSNMYYPNYYGQCTWFCWGRAHEKCGKSIRFNGGNNGGQWYDNCNYSASGVTKRAASLGPVTNSICSCTGSTSAGHVIFVELVDGNTVYYTEANVGGTDGVVKSCAKSSFPPNRTAKGYIVL